MSQQELTTRSVQGVKEPAKTATPAEQPQPAASTYSADLVQRLLDRAAHFSFYSSPEGRHDDSGARPDAAADIRGMEGFRISERLCRFQVVMMPPTGNSGPRASNAVGEQLGSFRSRWVLCPDHFEALPNREPPATLLDPNKRQRFVMLEGECALGDGDGFCGFGTGTTLPSTGGTLLAAAVGNVMEGRGRFAGLVGTYTYCGSLTHEGFRGTLMLRVMDPQGVIQTERTLPMLDSGLRSEPGVTYLIFRGQATETDKVTPLLQPDGTLFGLNVAQQLRFFQTDAAAGPGGLRSTSETGQVIGEIDAQIIFNPAAPGGDALDPIPYTAFDEYKFTDRHGQSAGSLFIDESEGRTFNLHLAGASRQQAIRFGGFGPILRGTGSLAGAAGLMTDNSVVSFMPHVSASVYVIRLNDPQGKYRVGGGGRDC